MNFKTLLIGFCINLVFVSNLLAQDSLILEAESLDGKVKFSLESVTFPLKEKYAITLFLSKKTYNGRDHSIEAAAEELEKLQKYLKSINSSSTITSNEKPKDTTIEKWIK